MFYIALWVHRSQQMRVPTLPAPTKSHEQHNSYIKLTSKLTDTETILMGFTHWSDQVPWHCSTSASICLCHATVNTIKHTSNNSCKHIALKSLQAWYQTHMFATSAVMLHNGHACLCTRASQQQNGSKIQHQENYNPPIIRFPKKLMFNYCEPIRAYNAV